MPYVVQDIRPGLDRGEPMLTPGDLNYCLTKVANEYMRYHGVSYQTCNDVLGAFDGASKEFYRRVVAPYEDRKLEQNGDVYTCAP